MIKTVSRHYDREIWQPVPSGMTIGQSFGCQISSLPAEWRGWSPYNYCMNNPLGLVDPDGMEIDESKLDDKNKKSFDKTVSKFSKSSARFKKIYNALKESDTVYKLTNDTKKETGYANKTINFKDYSKDTPTLIEELYHAYQDDNNMLIMDDGNRSVGVEVEAKLVAMSISNEARDYINITDLSNSEFGKYNSALYFGQKFDDSAWKGAISTFKQSFYNSGDHRYKDYSTRYYNPVLLKEMYPLDR